MKIMVIDMAVRQAINAYLADHGNMSQAAFARSAGISEQSVGRWLNSRRDFAVKFEHVATRLWDMLVDYLPDDYRQLQQSLSVHGIGEQAEDYDASLKSAESRAGRHNMKLSREVREILAQADRALSVEERVKIISICMQAIQRDVSDNVSK